MDEAAPRPAASSALRWRSWLVVFGLAACAHRPDISITPARTSFQRMNATAGSEHATLIVAWMAPVGRATWLPRVFVEPGASPRRWVVEGLRIEARPPRGLEVDTPPVLGVIEAVLPLERGWRIVTGDAVLDAAAFTHAPWTQLDLDGVGRPGRGAGRVVRVADGSLHGAPAPTDAPVIDAAFADDLRGVAVVEPGRAYRTEDGGARWLPVDGSGFSGALATASGRWLLDRERCVRVLDDGRALEVACDDVPTFRPDPSPLNRLLSLVPWRSPHASSPAAIPACTRFRACRPAPAPPCPDARSVVPDGSIVLCNSTPFGERGHRFHLFDGTEGLYRSVLSFRYPGGPVGDCSVRADGRAAACLGYCEALPTADEPVDVATYCLRLPNGTRVERRVDGQPSGELGFLGWRGDEPVLGTTSEARAGARLFERGRRERPLFGHVTPPMTAPRVNRGDLHPVGRDGRLRVRVFEEGGRAPTILEGVPGEGFVARAMPSWWDRAQRPDAERVVRVCGHDGVLLAGSTEDGLWVSERAEDPWRPLFSEGAPWLTRWLQRRRWPVAQVDCDAEGVHLPGVGRTLGWGSVIPPLEGAIDLPPPEATSQRSWPPSLTWDCQIDPNPASLCEPPSNPRLPLSEVLELVGIDRLSRLEGGASPSDVGRLWMLADVTPACPFPTQRAVSGVALPASDRPLGFVALTHQGIDTLSFLTLVPEGDRVDLTLFEQRGGAPARPRWQRGVHGTLRSEDRDTTFIMDGVAHDRVDMGSFGSVVAASDGVRVAASVQLPTWREGRSWRRLLIANRFGEAVRTRAFEYAESLTSGAYVLPDAAGVASVMRDGSLVGDDLEGRRVQLAPAIRWAPCGAAARGVIVLPTRVSIPYGADGENIIASARAEMGLDGGVLCLRRMVSSRFVHVPGATPHPTVGYVHSTRRWSWLTCAPR